MAVSDQIINVLDALCEKFGIVIDWTAANVFPYVETLCAKLVTWEIWSSITWIAVAIIPFIILLVITKPFSRQFRETLSEFECGGFFTKAAYVVLAIVILIVVSAQIFDIVKCMTFPELVIIDYIKKLTQPAA